MRDLSLHLMDIIQNSISAKATKVVADVKASALQNLLVIRIEDNGVGMDEEFLKIVSNPFQTTRTTRKVGLGISLYQASAQRAGGDLKITSALGKGTEVEASFEISNIDRLPLGDLAETMVGVILSKPEMELELRLSSDTETFMMETSEIREKIGEVPITELDILMWIKEYINEGIKSIFGGVLDEIHR